MNGKLVFRCVVCGDIVLSVDGTGLCACSSVGEPHPEGWTKLESILNGHHAWMCGDCQLDQADSDIVIVVFNDRGTDD